MRRQFTAALLIILTAAGVVCASINFQQQRRFRLPDDGVTWMEQAGRVVALHVVEDSPAARMGLRAGDRVLRISGNTIQRA
ncbi:MAG: hypothetical protein EHM65_07395, partial [Acidobacteriales bacterium]